MSTSTAPGRAGQAPPGAPRRRPADARRTAWRRRVPYLFLIPALLLELFVHFGPMVAGVVMSVLKLTQYQLARAARRTAAPGGRSTATARRPTWDSTVRCATPGTPACRRSTRAPNGREPRADPLRRQPLRVGPLLLVVVRGGDGAAAPLTLRNVQHDAAETQPDRPGAGAGAGRRRRGPGRQPAGPAASTDADQGYVHNRLPGYCRETAGAVALLREAIATLEIDADRLAASAGRHRSTSSALADDLVRTQGLSYRQAHDAVARFITAVGALADQVARARTRLLADAAAIAADGGR
jgi:hypothetical protein